MAYLLTHASVKQKFPIADYIRLGIMGFVILLTLIVIKVGGVLSNEREKIPAIEDQQFAGNGFSIPQGQGHKRI